MTEHILPQPDLASMPRFPDHSVGDMEHPGIGVQLKHGASN